MDPERLAFKPLPKGQGGEAEELWGLRAADPRKQEGGSRGGGAGHRAPRAMRGRVIPRGRCCLATGNLVKRYFGGEP